MIKGRFSPTDEELDRLYAYLAKIRKEDKEQDNKKCVMHDKSTLHKKKPG